MLNNILWFAAGFLTCFALFAAFILWGCVAVSKEMRDAWDE